LHAPKKFLSSSDIDFANNNRSYFSLEPPH
jgi:hypothetical protein